MIRFLPLLDTADAPPVARLHFSPSAMLPGEIPGARGVAPLGESAPLDCAPETAAANPPSSFTIAHSTFIERPPTAAAIDRTLAWRRILDQYDDIKKRAPWTSANACARLIGIGKGQLSKILARRRLDRLTPAFEQRGQHAAWSDFAAREDVRRELHALYLLSCGASSDYMTKGRRTGSMASTLKVFALSPLCPPDLAEVLRAGRQPIALVRVVRQMNDLHEQASRGAKHRSLNGQMIMRRTLTEILADGTEGDIQPGDWWVFDDMSDNLPHWWTGPKNEPLLGRQGLYAYDITQRWLGVEKVGTARDSYTAAIILRFVRRLMQALGKPRRGIIFERSVWQARTITGCRLTTTGKIADEEIELPALPLEEQAKLQDGLRALGIKLHYTYTPRGKEIEGAFNHLQRLKPMIAHQRAQTTGAPLAQNIGRHAGEYEHPAKQVRRVRNGSHHPEDLGFLHIDASRDLDLAVMEFILGPDAPAYPALAPLEPRDFAVFLPEPRELIIRDGRITATVDGQPLDFTAPELFAALGSGYRLAIKFDPSEPTLGAALYNAETSSANHRGWRVGEYVGWADFLPPVARFDWREGVDDPQADLRRRFNKHVRTAFGIVGLKHARASTARDGRGSVAEVSGSGSTPAAPLPPRGEASANPPPPVRRPQAAPAQDDPRLKEFLEA